MTAAIRSLVLAGTAAQLTLANTLPAQPRPAHPPAGGPGFLFHTPRVTLGLRGGFNLRPARDSIRDFFIQQLTLDRRDFNAVSIAGDLGIPLTGPMTLVLTGGYSRTSRQSEFRHYWDQNDLPITQHTTLSTTPLTLALRWDLVPRGRQVGRFVWIPRRVVPYVGAGGGLVRYSLAQVGEFVDSEDLSIFRDAFRSDGWTPLGLAMLGADYSLGRRVFVNADLRYLWARAGLRHDFVRFGDGLDLSGAQFSVGMHVRI